MGLIQEGGPGGSSADDKLCEVLADTIVHVAVNQVKSGYRSAQEVGSILREKIRPGSEADKDLMAAFEKRKAAILSGNG